MSGFKGTPGPWQAGEQCAYGWDVRDVARDCWIGMVHNDHGQSEMAKGGFPRNGQGIANARLIAAAPDLLEALQKLLDRYTSLVNCGDCGNWDPETEDEVIACRAALAKALGEDQEANQ